MSTPISPYGFGQAQASAGELTGYIQNTTSNPGMTNATLPSAQGNGAITPTGNLIYRALFIGVVAVLGVELAEAFKK